MENVDSAILNVSMPTVNWNREFGETNISVDLSRTIRNSFDISTGKSYKLGISAFTSNSA